MNDDRLRPHGEEALSLVTEQIRKDAADYLRANPGVFRGLLVLVVAVILSPLAVFCLARPELAKIWSEIVKNVAESGAVLAAVFAVIKWVNERRDRATDVLLRLENEFKDKDVMAGRNKVEDGDYADSEQRCDKLDAMLRFYVLLYGVYVARQVPERSLSICFRYWLAHYFRKDRTGFRAYVDRSYPTLKGWLRRDCVGGCSFFNPKPVFQEATDEAFINQCRVEKGA